MQSVLSANGFDSRAVGKMHFEPTTELHGFDARVFVEGKLFVGDDEYRQHLRKIGKRDLYLAHARRWNNDDDFSAVPSPLDDNEYIDTFIGDAAVNVLSDVKEPFFTWASFVNPHFPFDPPEPFDRMYRPDEMPLPEDRNYPQHSRIPEHRVSSGGKSFDRLTDDALRQAIAYYYGTISLVDREIGRLLHALESRGVLDGTLIMFTADHGELLGHRGMLFKGGRILYDHLLRVPMIVRYPPEVAAGQVVSHLTQATDIMPTVLDYVGIQQPPGVQGESLRPLLRVDSVPWREVVFSEGVEVKMIRDHHWKLIHYPGKRYGELYDLRADPLELHNLYDEPAYEKRRAAMMEALVDVLIETEDPLPLPTPRPGYYEASGFHSPQELSRTR
jgi:arylsulfatase A-like enzyme